MRSSSKNCTAKDVEPNALADAGCVVAVAWGKIALWKWPESAEDARNMLPSLAR